MRNTQDIHYKCLLLSQKGKNALNQLPQDGLLHQVSHCSAVSFDASGYKF